MATWNNSFIVAIFLSCALPQDAAVVSTTHGRVRGRSEKVLEKNVDVFLGIPYAKPPVGRLRFLKPQPIPPWDGVYDATSVKDSCMQPRVPFIFYIPTKLSEDCLYLNVWTPKASTKTKLPVLLWFHGGIFKLGSAYVTRYNGPVLPALNDVVVVSCNFRNGAFGFLDANNEASPGNMALWDQVLVMQWVQKNIRAFGGDPELVTVFGESSGSMDIHLHLISPVGRGLFRRYFSMSGTETTNSNVESVFESIAKGNAVAAALGCANSFQDLTNHPDKVIDCLRSRSPEEIIDATENVTSPKVLGFLPTFNTEYVPYLPTIATEKGLYRAVDALVSVVANEGAFPFVMQPEALARDDVSGYEYKEFVAAIKEIIRNWLKPNVVPLGLAYLEDSPSNTKVALRQRAADFVGKQNFFCPTKIFSEGNSNRKGAVYGFVFAHRSQKSKLPQWMHVVHMEDIPYFFGFPFLDNVNYTDEDRRLSTYAMDMLVSFARDGKPTVPQGQQWPSYSVQQPKFLWLQPGNYTLVDFYEGDTCTMWRKF
ncbi:acetylcholinesterase-like [Amblyomma americanum]